MPFLKALLFAVVEGITEFLPISSTGHMIIVDEYVRLTSDKAFNDAFIVIIQLPAILSVVVYFWPTLWPFGKGREEQAKIIQLWSKIVVAFLPAAVLGFLFDDMIEAVLFNPFTVCIALIVGGIVLIAIERRRLPVRVDDPGQMGYGKAVAIGFFQCLAMIPGTSRSAATIIGAMLLGASRPVAAEFSFFLAIPTMLGATTLKILKNGLAFTGEQWMLLAVGSVVSFAVAYAVVAFLMSYVKKHDFKVFGYYRIVLGALVIMWFFLTR